MNKADSLRVELLSLQSAFCGGQHFLARIYHGYPRVATGAKTLDQESAIPFTSDQNIFGRSDPSQKCRAAALQFFPRENKFHPAIMRRQPIKAHGAAQIKRRCRDSTKARKGNHPGCTPPHPANRPSRGGSDVVRCTQTERTKQSNRERFHPAQASGHPGATSTIAETTAAAAARRESAADR